MPKTKETTRTAKGAAKRECKRTHTPEGGNHDLNQVTAMKLHDERLLLQMGDKMITDDYMIAETSKKAFEASSTVVSPSHIKNGMAELIVSSTSRPSTYGNAKSQTANAVQESLATRDLDLEFCEGTFKNQVHKYVEPSDSGRGHLNGGVIDDSNVPLPLRQKVVGASSKQSGITSSDEISAKSIPSLQFFVMSEEGINLYVDLDSPPSAWLNDLKDAVSIAPRLQQPEPGSISSYISGLVHSDDQKTISPSESTMMTIEGKGFKKSTPCINSSISSAVTENCQSGAYLPDATAANYGSSTFRSASAPIEAPGFQEEIQVVSSSCLTSNIRGCIGSVIATCPLDRKLLPRETIGRTQTSDATALINGGINAVCPDGTEKSYDIECSVMKYSMTDCNGVAACTFGKSHKSNSRDNVIPTFKEINKLEVFVDNPKSYRGAHEVSTESVQVDGSTEDVDYGDRFSMSCQMIIGLPMSDELSDVRSADHLSFGNSNPNDQMTSTDALGSAQSKKRESPESSQFHGSLDKHSKRVCNSEEPEDFQSKRQHSCAESKTRSQTTTKETQQNLIIRPRRSTRLFSK